MSYQDAIERAIALRLRVRKETDEERKGVLLALAQQWEAWAEACRAHAARGEAPDPTARPSEDI